jgi:hypothetical protein
VFALSSFIGRGSDNKEKMGAKMKERNGGEGQTVQFEFQIFDTK